MKLLTIAIPTYNRADRLELLLRTLQSELAGLEGEVDVTVSDNASADRTPGLLADCKSQWPAVTLHVNGHNVGADENFCGCVDRMDSQYFWIIGDDDLPKAGVVRKVVALLKDEAPDLVYLDSEWVNLVVGPEQGEQVGHLRYQRMSQATFANKVHVWFTFISGVIVNRERLGGNWDPSSIRKYAGTNLAQLGWVLPALKSGSKFIFITDRCILATRGNTGGYAVMKVFGADFTEIVHEIFGRRSEVARAILAPHLTSYLPQLIWDTRFRSVGDFLPERGWITLREALGDRAAFWLLITPMIWLPKPLARVFLLASRVVRRAGLEWTRWRHRGVGRTCAPLVQPVEPSAGGDRAR